MRETASESVGTVEARAAPCPMCDSHRISTEGVVEGYTFVACDDCAFTYSPQISPDFLAERYADGYHGADEGAPDEGWAQTRPDFLDVAMDLLHERRPLRILDFGTGDSLTPSHLRRWGHHVTAIDVQPPLHPHPDRLVGDLIEERLPKSSFDLTYAFQVFEHLPRPRPYLDELLRVTKVGGLVLIHTDMEMPERDEGLEEWWYVLPPDHCAFYRHKTFDRYITGTPHRIVHRDPKRIVIRRGAGGDVSGD